MRAVWSSPALGPNSGQRQSRRFVCGERGLAEGEGFEPPKACTLVVFKPVAASFATVRGRSPASAAYFTLALFVRRSSPAFTIVRRGCRHGSRHRQPALRQELA